MCNVFIEDLIKEMTLEEKVGQCVQLSADYYEVSGEITGPKSTSNVSLEDIKNTGSVLGIFGAEEYKNIQSMHIKNHRLNIPLLFMADIVHGCNTIFPVPIGLGSSFNPKLAYESSRVAALEGRQQGIHVTFAPMLDLAVDPRWGRNMEATSEDPYLNTLFAKAYVEGFQDSDDNQKESMASCIKHFAAYGMVKAGREYNTVDLSKRMLMSDHIPSYKAGIDAGASMVMTAFNTYDSIPCTGNKYLMNTLLRDKLGFDKTVISDWGAVKELINHQVASDDYMATVKSFNATCDIDMMANSYNLELLNAVNNGDVSLQQLDDAVRRILTLKYDLGLFDDPYKFINPDCDLLSKKSLEIAKQASDESIVLLKNNNNILPIKTDNYAITGPMADSSDLMGPWSWHGKQEDVVSNAKYFREENPKINYVSTNGVLNTMHFKNNDIVIYIGGENSYESGESNSKTNINLEASQVNNIKTLFEAGKKVVYVNYSGRPLVLTDIEPYTEAIIQAWFPGTMASASLYDIITGKVNPSGKLSMSFPRNIGQCPLSYREYQTGRPKELGLDDYVSKYIDSENTPLYQFGQGLSYSDCNVKEVELSSNVITDDVDVKITGVIENNSDLISKEVLQVYLNDKCSDLIRPLKELIYVDKFEVENTKEFNITITKDMLKYIDSEFNKTIEDGEVELFIGIDSTILISKTIEVR